MPKVSSETASEKVTTEGLEVRLEHLAQTMPVVLKNLKAAGVEVEAER
jgi:hypothetical protein